MVSSTTSLQSTDSIASQVSTRLQELANNLRSRARRMGRDIYWQGRDLLEAKELFGRGQNKAFLDWAREYAHIQTTLVYRFMQVAKAFPEFEDEDFEVVATALYEFASPSTPQPARFEFLDRSREGEIVSLPEAEAIIQRYKGTEDKQFDHYQSLVRPWGTLEAINEDPYKLRLRLPDGQTQDFRTYTALKAAYTAWRRAVFATDLQTIRELVAPDWHIRPCPVPNQPFRLEMTCQIPGRNKTLIIDTPRSLIEWWYHRGKSLTERLNQPATEAETSLQSIQTKDFQKPSCLSCGWYESESHAVDSNEYWCGFYRSAFGLEQQYERPSVCRKWHPAIAQQDTNLQLDVYPAEFSETCDSENTPIELVQAGVNQRSIAPATLESNGETLPFEAILQAIPKLNTDQLLRLENAIQTAKASQIIT